VKTNEIELQLLVFMACSLQINVRVATVDAELEFTIQSNTTGRQLFDQVSAAQLIALESRGIHTTYDVVRRRIRPCASDVVRNVNAPFSQSVTAAALFSLSALSPVHTADADATHLDN